MKTVMKEAKRIIREEGPMTALALKDRLLEMEGYVRMTRITTNRLAQCLKRKPFTVHEKLSDHTKVYTLMEE